MSTSRSKTSSSKSFNRYTCTQLEEQIVRRRQAECERLNFWNNNCTYFKTWDFNTNLYSQWSSDNGLEKLKKKEEAREKRELLEKRREKLKELIKTEEKTYSEELKEKAKKPVAFEDLNAANIEILLREEEARRRERDIKMHHYWRQNQPSLRDFERKLHSDFVKKSWIHQIVEKRKEKEEEEKKMIEYMKELKKLQEEHEERDKRLREERKKTELELKEFLTKQIELVKCKEEQEKILKKEETETLKLQNELENMMEERKKLEEKRKRVDLSLFHKRQYQQLLKKRAREVQENLDVDKSFLDKLAGNKNYEAGVDPERVLKYKKDLELAIQICKKQSELEKLRKAQAEYLFDEEAKKLYQTQEANWEKEAKARQKLMDDVLRTLQIQIKEKLIENLKSQDEAKQMREEMLKKIETTNRELEEYKEKTKTNLDSWKNDLNQQVLDKKLELYYKKKKQEEDKENELKAKREEEEKICKELAQMYLTGYQPKSARRKTFSLL